MTHLSGNNKLQKSSIRIGTPWYQSVSLHSGLVHTQIMRAWGAASQDHQNVTVVISGWGT